MLGNPPAGFGSRSPQQFDLHGDLKNPSLEQRLHEVGNQVARFAYLHKCAAAHDFLADWQKAQPNPGA
jgi:hypothetical protein